MKTREGNGFKFYVDKDEAQWTRQNNLVKIDIRPLNVPRLVSHGTKLLWLGIPDDAIIGALHIKTIHLSEVKRVLPRLFWIRAIGIYG